MRESVTEELAIDMLIPINYAALPPMPTCFGKLWDCKEGACKNCKVENVCGTATIKVNKEISLGIENGTTFLSKCLFEKIDKKALLDTLLSESEPPSYDTLQGLVSEESGFKDKVTLNLWVNNFLTINNFEVKEGLIYEK